MAEEELSIKDLVSKAIGAEETGNNTLAIELYNEVLKSDKLNVYAYNRLMKIFRQLKGYKKELAIINRAVKAYEQFYKSGSKTKSKKVNEISQKLNRSFGLTDKKGNNLYDPEPIATWKKRKENVEKKLK